MELLNNIWSALTTPNETLINIILIPSAIIEAILILLIFIGILNLNTSKKQNIVFIILVSSISLINTYFIPSPINTFINYIGMFIIVKLIFKTTILQSLFASIIPTIIFALVGTLIMNPFYTILNINYEQLISIPLYRIIYLLLVYFIIFSLTLLLKLKNYKIQLPDYAIDRKTKNVLFINLFVGFITLIIQLIITIYYTDTLPILITFLSFLSLLAYFSISIYSLTRIMKLAVTTQKLQNAEEYNRTLTILHDNVRGFKHDFDNIVTTIGGYVKTNDMEGLKKYYLQLEDDCQKVNNLYILNPELINNPGVYSLLTTKYHEADEKEIKINMSFLLDLSKLNMKIYEFTRVLGILLDNAIDASSECEEKVINIIFRDDSKNHRQLITIENTYKNKDVDTEKIFYKGFSGKENHTGLGLWEVKKILNKSKNLSLYTSKNDKYFSQQLEIYY